MLSMGTNSKIVFFISIKEILQCKQKERPTHLLTLTSALQKLRKIKNQLNPLNPRQKENQP